MVYEMNDAAETLRKHAALRTPRTLAGRKHRIEVVVRAMALIGPIIPEREDSA